MGQSGKGSTYGLCKDGRLYPPEKLLVNAPEGDGKRQALEQALATLRERVEA